MNFEIEYQAVLRRITSDFPHGFSEGDLASSRLPEALMSAYRLAGKSRINQQHNRLLSPDRLVMDSEGMVVFAEENQNVVIWGYKVADDHKPVVYQRQFDGEAYGDWTEEGSSMEHFLISFAYWNGANGAADVSGVGEISDASRELLAGYPIVWRSSDFEVRGKSALFVIIGDGDFYCFGTDEQEVESLAEALQVEWFDMG